MSKATPKLDPRLVQSPTSGGGLTMSSCLIRGVRSVELVSSNLAEAARFYADVLQLAPAETQNNAQYFHGTGSYRHVLGLNLGNQPAVIRVVFDLADRHAITVLHRAMSGAGLKSTAPAELSTPGRGYGFGCKDPDGRNLVFVCDCADYADNADRTDRPRKIAHVNLNARNFYASLTFFTQTLGFRLVDENAPLGFCIAPIMTIARSRWRRPACRHSTTSRSKCLIPIR